MFKTIEIETIKSDHYELYTDVEFIDDVNALETSNIKPFSEAKTLMKKSKISKISFY